MGQRSALAARDADIQASIEPVAVLAGRYGISAGHVKRIRAEVPQPPVRTRKERFQLEVVEGGWRADCMDEGEWTDWVRQNPMGLYDRAFAERPCRDCPLGFAADMRAIGRCNGTPGNPASEPADHHDDEEGEDEGPMLNQNERSGGGPGRGAAGARAAALCDVPPRAGLRPQDRAPEGDISRGQHGAAA